MFPEAEAAQRTSGQVLFHSAVGDIWSEDGAADAIVVTTNGFVTKDGRGVMGAGIAKQAKDRFPGIEEELGKHLRANGNVPGIIGETADGTKIVSFPTKPAGRPGQPGWKEASDPS